MTRRAIRTDAAPAAIGPYSQAIVAGDLVFCSGQIPLDPATGDMVGETAAAQAEQVLRNLEAVLAAAGASFGHVVKATIFLVDMADFTAVNEVYARAFGGGDPPARACVAVRALPKGARVEIEAIARL
jgi:2-iminobutanoate/2-iminopropanoate deaminase